MGLRAMATSTAVAMSMAVAMARATAMAMVMVNRGLALAGLGDLSGCLSWGVFLTDGHGYCLDQVRKPCFKFKPRFAGPRLAMGFGGRAMAMSAAMAMALVCHGCCESEPKTRNDPRLRYRVTNGLEN